MWYSENNNMRSGGLARPLYRWLAQSYFSKILPIQTESSAIDLVKPPRVDYNIICAMLIQHRSTRLPE